METHIDSGMYRSSRRRKNAGGHACFQVTTARVSPFIYASDFRYRRLVPHTGPTMFLSLPSVLNRPCFPDHRDLDLSRILKRLLDFPYDIVCKSCGTEIIH